MEKSFCGFGKKFLALVGFLFSRGTKKKTESCYKACLVQHTCMYINRRIHLPRGNRFILFDLFGVLFELEDIN